MYIEAEQQTMLKYGVHMPAEELNRYTGTTAEFMFTELIKNCGLNTTFEGISRGKEEILFKLMEKEARLAKGVIELLRKLKQKSAR